METKQQPKAGAIAAVVDASGYLALTGTRRAIDVIRQNLDGEPFSEFDLDRVKVPAGGGTTWLIPSVNGDQEAKAIEGVIVLRKSRRMYWSGDTISHTPPDCSSRDMVRGVGTPGGECATCPFAAFGTSHGGKGRGKACKEVSVVFVLRQGDSLPITIIAPPSSLGPMRTYLSRLPTYHYGVVTRFELLRTKSKDGTDYSQIAPKLVGVLDDATAELFGRYGESLRSAIDGQAVEAVTGGG